MDEDSKTYTTASTPLQYLSHIDRNFGWPAAASVNGHELEKTLEHTCYIPYAESHVAFSYFSKVKGHSRDDVFAPLFAWRN
jgi:hypothetical protein